MSDELCLSNELDFTIVAYFLSFLTSDDNIAPLTRLAHDCLGFAFVVRDPSLRLEPGFSPAECSPWMGGRVTPRDVLSADSVTLLCFIAATK